MVDKKSREFIERAIANLERLLDSNSVIVIGNISKVAPNLDGEYEAMASTTITMTYERNKEVNG